MDKAKFIEWLKSDDVLIAATEAEIAPFNPNFRMLYVILTHPAECTFEGMAQPVIVQTRTLTDEEKKEIQDGWEADEEFASAPPVAIQPVPVRMLREEEKQQEGWE